MGKIYNRNLGTTAMLKKLVPDAVLGDDFKGAAFDPKLDKRMYGVRTCRFCQMPMEFYKDMGGIVIWHCTSEYCVNNPDCKLKHKMDFDGQFFATQGSQQKLFEDWMPKRLV